LRTEVLTTRNTDGVEWAMVKLQRTRDDFTYTLHAYPHTYSISGGLQIQDLLSHLGFISGACPFVSGRQCMATQVPQDFAFEAFTETFSPAYKELYEAERKLQNCGISLRDSGRPGRSFARGDGHTSPIVERMKETEDGYFKFTFTWLEGGTDKGWTTHYHPKHLPLSDEMHTALKFIELNEFATCPEFDFDHCYWTFIPFQQSVRSGFDSNAGVAHQFFDKHIELFSPGLELLLNSHRLLEPFGFHIMGVIQHPTDSTTSLTTSPLQTHIPSATISKSTAYEYDVAVSFAGSQRHLAEALSNKIREKGYNVFYDHFYPEQLWGKDLAVFFQDVYKNKARYCVMFISGEYRDREWTIHERSSAQARAIVEKGNEYILPIEVEPTDLPGLPSTVGRLSLTQYSLEEIIDILVRKLEA